MADELSVVGRSIPRLDGADKASGTAQYTADIKLPGMLIGKVLRSPYPHARIVRIDTSRAEKLAGVEAVITYDNDVPKKIFNRNMLSQVMADPVRMGLSGDEYILCDKARYVGDAIAAVAAVDIYKAEEAIDLIDVEYEQLPAVFDPYEAMKPGAPVIHEGIEQNIAKHMIHHLAIGDVEKGLEEADYILEDTFNTSRQKHAQLEPDAAVVRWSPDGRVTVWSPCQLAHPARRAFAQLFDIGEGMVRWVSPIIGGGFGGRLSLTAEPICAALAKKAGKPVKLVYTREEDFSAHESRSPFIYTLKMGVKKNGTITALDVKAIVNAGAYCTHSPIVTNVSFRSILQLYRCQNTAAEAYIVYTNTPVSGGMRGYGNPQSTFVMEQLIDLACEKIGMDPMEFRLKNHRGAGETSQYSPAPMEQCALGDCIKLGAERIGWADKRARSEEEIVRRGIGMSIMQHDCGGGPALLEHSNAFIKLNEDGSFNLFVSPAEMGQGILGVLGQIAAEQIGVAAEDIHIVSGDTDITHFEVGSHASRSTYVIGNAVARAAMEVKRQILERAAKILEVPPDELEIKNRHVYSKESTERRISVSQVVVDSIYDFQRSGSTISGKGSFQSNAHQFQAAFAEVAVNAETGELKVLRYVVAHDIGKSINPLNVEGQLEGGTIQGIGYALLENYMISANTGKTITDSFATYKIPTILDIPKIETILVEEGIPSGPFGAKGVGEPGLVNVAAAIANALYNALGIRFTELPITPEKILEALKAK